MGAASPLVLITGTGTGIGKTHIAAALLEAWGRTRQVVGYKPVETGVAGPRSGAGRATRGRLGEDARLLTRLSTFHVKHAVLHQTFRDGISPHLAARREGRRVDIGLIVRQVTTLRRASEGVVVELAGGLFSPLSDRRSNAHLALRLWPTAVVLVAPDRLGVLHDLAATLAAARAIGLRIRGVACSAPEVPDASTHTNVQEVMRVLHIDVLARFPRAPLPARSTRRAAHDLLQALDITHRTD